MENEQNSGLDFPKENIFQILTSYKDKEISEELPEKERANKFHVTKSKTKGKNSVTDLPEEILLEILIKFPAKDLHENIRCVCKRWRKLVSSSDFIAQHMLQNQSQVLIVNRPDYLAYKTCQVKELEMDNKALDFNLNTAPIPRMIQQILSSFNGLILMHNREERWLLHLQVVNLITKCSVTLPKCPSGCMHVRCGTAITFDPSTSVYKVVHMYADGFGFEIFTLGCSDNAWKTIPGPFRAPDERPFNLDTFQWTNPVTINGQFLYWYVESDRYIISMNIRDEKWRRIYLPGYNRYRYDLLDMGGHLALFYKLSNAQIDVWILEDFEKQDWIKRHSIMAESINYTKKSSIRYTRSLPDFRKLGAVTVLQDGKVIMFRNQRETHDCYLYDINKGELKRFKMKIKSKTNFIHHKSSLVCW